jgi:glycosyltransferase involved in cell wall biosynthesis
MIAEHNGAPFRLVPAADRAAFRQAALDLSTSPRTRRNMGRRAQRFFDDHFEWSKIADRIRSSLPHSPVPSAA